MTSTAAPGPPARAHPFFIPHDHLSASDSGAYYAYTESYEPPSGEQSSYKASQQSFNGLAPSDPARERSISGSYNIGQRKMSNTVRASNKAAILAVGEELRLLLHEEEPPLIKDRRYHLRVYQECFAGHDMVDWLLSKGEVETRSEAVAMMQKLLENGVIHHGELRQERRSVRLRHEII